MQTAKTSVHTETHSRAGNPATVRKNRRAPNQTPFGCQLWVEPGDTPERIDRLVGNAVRSGLSRVRIFLMWTWIERTPGEWDFRLYDAVFEAAGWHMVGIKATLTANSGPWHIGTPGVLHSHTGFLAASQEEPMRRYIEACVRRYRKHPALAQWLLWNEPHGASRDRTELNLALWRTFLKKTYGGDLQKLNQRWLTGYSSFDEVLWPEEIPNPVHRSGAWLPYRAELDESRFRAWRIAQNTQWVATEVRRWDKKTELALNPIFNIENQAGGGTDLKALAAVVDRMGASYHPVFWHSQVRRQDYPAMIGAGVRALLEQSGGKPCELTEVVSGNTVVTGSRPSTVTPPEIARFYLAGLACGAQTVTGWTLNARHRDSETGEFALLDDNDGLTLRSAMLARLAQCVASAQARTGAWSAAPIDVYLPLDSASQAVEMLDSRYGDSRFGIGANDSGRGQWMLAQRLMELGMVAANVSFADLPPWSGKGGEVAIVSHVIAWEAPHAQQMLAFAKAGGTLVLDALSGRKDFDSRQHRPWPGILGEEIGLRVAELESRNDNYTVRWGQETAGTVVLARSRLELQPDAQWRVFSPLRFELDGEPAAVERPYGKGRIVVLRFPLGPSLLANPDRDGIVRALLRSLTSHRRPALQPSSGVRGLVTIPIACAKGRLVAVLAPESSERCGLPLWLSAGDDHRPWYDFWSGAAVCPDPCGEIKAAAPEGIALLWRAE